MKCGDEHVDAVQSDLKALALQLLFVSANAKCWRMSYESHMDRYCKCCIHAGVTYAEFGADA